MNKPRNYSLHHEDNPHLNDVTSHEDGTCTFMHDSSAEGAARTITGHGRHGALFSISIGPDGAAYQILQTGEDMGLFTLWDDET